MAFDEEFQRIWARYPKRDKKIASKDAFRWALQNHDADGTLLEKIHQALTWQIEVHSEWRYWVTLDKWLLAQRWEDDPPIQREIHPTAAERTAYTQWARSVGPFVAKDRPLLDWVKRQRGAA